MKKLITTLAIVLATVVNAETPTITGVTAQQRYPWNGKVDISYTVAGDIAAEAKARALVASLKVVAINTMANTTNIATQLSGDASLSAGTHNIVWDMDAEGLSFKSSNVVFTVVCETTSATYCVIDLSDGANAELYPIEYLNVPPDGGFNTDEYKTTKLVLRRIESGSFKMGGQYDVTLTKPFFCGIFEVTQRQWELIMGTKPSYFNNAACYATRPVESISYGMIRGSSNGVQWPSSSAVDVDSFLGKLRTRTGIDFDLPTEAQWEYACRAGTTTDYNSGKNYTGNTCVNMNEVGRYCYNGGQDNSLSSSCDTSTGTAKVGSYQPNAWGLYDMHGNVWEWCLDWYNNSIPGGTDPKGCSAGSLRVLRGGSWTGDASYCVSSSRGNYGPSKVNINNGVRLVRTLSNAETEQSLDVFCSGKSGEETIDLASGTRKTTLTERIRYSAEWVSGASEDAIAVIEVNGGVLNAAMGSGYVDWKVRQSGIYTMTHKVLFGGEQVGETLSATFRVESPIDTPVFSPVDDTRFINASQEITITCDTIGATILYTTDGRDPVENGIEYKGPFSVYESCTVRAIARKFPFYDSEEASVRLTRAEGLSEAANLYGYLMETDGSYPWTVVTDVSHDGVSCVRSGAIGNGGTTHLLASVRKAGTVSFWWKAACEDADVEDDETYYYDYGVFLVDDVEKAWIAGHDTGWRKVVVEVPSGGKHVLRWEYRKDGATSYAPDCVWLDQVQWIPADGGGYTLTTPEPVPYAWLSGYGLGGDSDFETAAKGATGKRGGDGRALQVWQDYVAGTDPTNAASVFTAGIEFVGGVPQVTWSSNLNTNGIERIYTIWGKTNLTDGADWECPTNAAHRFFKVMVEMP